MEPVIEKSLTHYYVAPNEGLAWVNLKVIGYRDYALIFLSCRNADRQRIMRRSWRQIITEIYRVRFPRHCDPNRLFFIDQPQPNMQATQVLRVIWHGDEARRVHPARPFNPERPERYDHLLMHALGCDKP